MYSKDEVSQSDAYSHSLIQVSFFFRQAACGQNVPVKECMKRIVMTVRLQYMVTDAYQILVAVFVLFFLHSHNLLNPTKSA